MALVASAGRRQPGPSTVLVIADRGVAGRRGGLLAALRHDGGRARLGGGGAVRPAGAVRAASTGSTSPSHRRRGSIWSISRCMLWRQRAIRCRKRGDGARAATGRASCARCCCSSAIPRSWCSSAACSCRCCRRPAGLDGGACWPSSPQRIHLVRAARPAVLGRRRRGPSTAGQSLARPVMGGRWRCLRPMQAIDATRTAPAATQRSSSAPVMTSKIMPAGRQLRRR